MTSIRERAEKCYEDYFSVAPKYRTGQRLQDCCEAALREFGEELAKMCEERGEICKQIAAGGTTHSYCLIFLGRAEECQERARAIRESL